jgi:hypothetical protein
VRQYAIRAIGRHLAAGEGAQLRTDLGDTTDIPLKRVLLIAIAEGDGVDASLLDAVGRAEPLLRHTCDYLRSGVTLPEP